MNTIQVTDKQYKIIIGLLQEQYSLVNDGYWNHESGPEATKETQNLIYNTIQAVRLSKANKAWKQYIKDYPDVEWRMYPSKSEFLKDQYCIYPEDLKKLKVS